MLKLFMTHAQASHGNPQPLLRREERLASNEEEVLNTVNGSMLLQGKLGFCPPYRHANLSVAFWIISHSKLQVSPFGLLIQDKTCMISSPKDVSREIILLFEKAKGKDAWQSASDNRRSPF